MSSNRRWKVRPEGSNWGEFGDDDELGRLNLITPAAVRRGAAEIHRGISFCLSLPLDLPGGSDLSPLRRPPVLAPVATRRAFIFNHPLTGGNPDHTDVVCDDAVHLYTQYSTQWDALSHVSSLFDADGDGIPEIVYYNGFRAGIDIISPADERSGQPGAGKLGIEKMAEKAIQSRGIFVDLAAKYGRRRQFVGFEELMQALGGQAIEQGDILCLYSGFADLIVEMAGKPNMEILEKSCAVLDGRDVRLQNWIAASGLAAIVADNYAVEGIPARFPLDGRHPAWPLHELCLVKLGLPLGELWYFEQLAVWLRAERRNRFFLTAPPLRLPHAVGSPLTPVATV